MAKTNLYALVSNVDGGSIQAVMIAHNDGILIRDNLPNLKRIFPYLMDDMEFRHVACLEDGGKVTPIDVPRPVSWDSYKFPENPVTPLSPQETAQLKKE